MEHASIELPSARLYADTLTELAYLIRQAVELGYRPWGMPMAATIEIDDNVSMHGFSQYLVVDVGRN